MEFLSWLQCCEIIGYRSKLCHVSLGHMDLKKQLWTHPWVKRNLKEIDCHWKKPWNHQVHYPDVEANFIILPPGNELTEKNTPGSWKKIGIPNIAYLRILEEAFAILITSESSQTIPKTWNETGIKYLRSLQILQGDCQAFLNAESCSSIAD